MLAVSGPAVTQLLLAHGVRDWAALFCGLCTLLSWLATIAL